MKKIIILPLFLILVVANLYGENAQNVSKDNNDSLSTNHVIINKKSENEQKNKLKIPEGISKNNLDQVFGSSLCCKLASLII